MLKTLFQKALLACALVVGPSFPPLYGASAESADANGSSLAAPGDVNEKAEMLQDYNYWSEFLKMIFALLLLLGVAALLLTVAKRVIQKKIKIGNKTNLIKIIERRSLSPRCHVYAVGILDRLLIVGESPSGIHTLAELPPGTHLEAIFKQQKGGGASSPAQES